MVDRVVKGFSTKGLVSKRCAAVLENPGRVKRLKVRAPMEYTRTFRADQDQLLVAWRSIGSAPTDSYGDEGGTEGGCKRADRPNLVEPAALDEGDYPFHAKRLALLVQSIHFAGRLVPG